jgi:hypothetical protein
MKRKIFILLFITIIFSGSVVAQEEQNWPSKHMKWVILPI